MALPIDGSRPLRGATCTERKPVALGCQRCAASTAAGTGASIGDGGLWSVRNGKPVGAPLDLPALTALAATPSGHIWAVSAQEDDGLPHALILTHLRPRGELLDELEARFLRIWMAV